MNNSFLFSLNLLAGCRSDQETISPVIQNITESGYASGVIKSDNQYHVFACVSGNVGVVFVNGGAAAEIGAPILSIADDSQKLMTDNAKLSAEFNALYVNRGKLDEARSFVDLTKSKMKSDSPMLKRQRDFGYKT
jgi:HlyD family secretion protein